MSELNDLDKLLAGLEAEDPGSGSGVKGLGSEPSAPPPLNGSLPQPSAPQALGGAATTLEGSGHQDSTQSGGTNELSGYGRSTLADDAWNDPVAGVPGVPAPRPRVSGSEIPIVAQNLGDFASRETQDQSDSSYTGSRVSMAQSQAEAKRKTNFDRQQFVARKQDEIKRQLEALTLDSSEMAGDSEPVAMNTDQIDLLRKLKEKVESRLETRSNYRGLIGFFGYLIVYFVAIVVQLKTSTSFDVEKSLGNVYVKPLEDRSLVQEDFYTWLEGPILAIFDDPICGNSACDVPSEYPQVGRFGCAKDCGVYPNVSTLYVRATDRRIPDGKTRADIPYLQWLDENDREPNYKWNAYSWTLNRWLYESNQVAVPAPMNFEVPDGRITVCKFQENHLYGRKVSKEVLQQTSYSDPSTIPDVPEWQGYQYGDFTEALTLSSSVQVEYLVSVDPLITQSPDFNPIGNDGLNYGLDIMVFRSDLSGAVTLAVQSDMCQLSPSEIALAATGSNCPPGSPACYDLDKMEELFLAKNCSSCSTVVVNNYGTGEQTANPIPNFFNVRQTTPSNALIGAVAIYQTRYSEVLCKENNYCDSTCQGIRQNSFGEIADFLWCKEGRDDKAYGIDPTFFESSSIYDGSLPPQCCYNTTELQGSLPYGFFPMKDSISSFEGSDEGKQYAAYLDTRMSKETAERAIKYLREGFFIDNLTDTVTVQFATFNGEDDVLAKLMLTFKFNLGGGLELQKSLHSISLAEFQNLEWSYAFAALITIGAFVQVVPEFQELKSSFSGGQLSKYLMDVWNLLDWYAFLCLPLSLWFFIGMAGLIRSDVSFVKDINATNLGIMPAVLADPSRKQRAFETVESEELRFYTFLEKLTQYTTTVQYYQLIVAINVIVLVLRLLKVMDFQGRMGLITRTLGRSFQDIFHFLLLYSMVVSSFAIMGQKLYGRQMDGYKDFGKSVMTLFQLTLGIGNDPYSGMISANDSVQWFTSAYYICFVILSSVVLLNILLAILVDAFALVKETASESESLYAGIRDTILYDIRRTRFEIGRLMRRTASSSYLSDEKLDDLLVGYLASVDKTDELEEIKLTKEEEEDQKVLQLDDDLGLTHKQLAGLLVLMIKKAPATAQEASKVSSQRKWSRVKGQVVNAVLTSIDSKGSKSFSSKGSKDQDPAPDQSVGKALKLWKVKPSAVSPDPDPSAPKPEDGSGGQGAEGSGGSGATKALGLWQKKPVESKPPIESQGSVAKDPPHISKLVKYWTSVGKDIANSGTGKAFEGSSDTVKNEKLRRLVRLLMRRYGKDEDDDEEQYLNKMKMDVLHNQYDWFKRYYDLEAKVSTIEENMTETVTSVEEIKDLLTV